MTFLSLPRKWRPRFFSDLIGQDAVSRTLANAIGDGRVASAYLLTGPRGVGKTSTARLLARALNCDKGPTIQPCGECASCKEILARGDSLDVHEIDGASNRKIENTRELIETVRYAPQRDRYRIAIIDEVHMLTTEAFNALLKTLEEPPPHARFILASTELHKIPPTIVSRCQRFRFRSLSVPEIAQQLTKVAEQEGIRATSGALAMLSNAADGSLRDALSLLDQAATLAAGGEVNEAECVEILALVNSELLEALYSAIASGDRGAAIATLNRLLESGEDPRHVGKELVRLLQRLLLLSAGAKGDLTEAEQKRLDPLARAMPYENLLRGVSLCVESQELARRADDSALVVQMLVLKLAELPRLKKIEDVLSSGAAAKPSPTSLPEPPRADSRGPRIVSIVPVEPEREIAPAPVRTSDPRATLERFHALLESRRRIAAAQASLAESAEVVDDELVLRFGIDKAAAKEALEEPATRKMLAEVAREAFGRPLKVVLKTGPPADGDLGQAARDVDPGALSRERASSRVEADPVVRSALELFRGELTEVKEEE